MSAKREADTEAQARAGVAWVEAIGLALDLCLNEID